MIKYRKTLDKIKCHASKERILILLGARQVGKTTLMQMWMEEIRKKGETCHYFTLEKASNLELLGKGVDGLKESGILTEDKKKFLFIDEFHYLANANHLFKEIYDTLPNVHIIATGSSSLEIQQTIKESLVGRKLTLFVHPLDFLEYMQFLAPDEEALKRETHFFETVDPEGATLRSKSMVLSHYQQNFLNFVLYGGLPKIALEPDMPTKQIYLEEIFNTYLQKDIKGILKNIEIAPFNQILQLITSQIGNLLNIAELSNTLHLKRREIVHYLEILQETFVNFLLKPLASNKRGEVIKTPKTFFYDNGLRNQILKQFAPLHLRRDGGALLENAVFMELKKNLPVSQDIYYWRTKNKTEVDFVLRLNEKLFPIEIKMGAEKNIPPNLKSFCEIHSVSRAFIVNAKEWSSKKDGKTTYFWIPHFLAGKIPEWIS